VLEIFGSGIFQSNLACRKLRHPHVVSVLGAHISESGPDMYIVTEFMPRGSVSDLLHNKNLVIEYEHVRKIALDCCKGMAYLHRYNVIHRDLKTPNLLVDNQWKVKVSDFGLSRMVKGSDTAQSLTACGTPSWAAPEVLNDQRYSQKADVYSFAICLWELCTRKDPYADMTAPQVVIFIAVKGKRLKIPKSIPPVFDTLIRETWITDPDLRPDFVALSDRFEAIKVLPVPVQPHPYELSSLSSPPPPKATNQYPSSLNPKNVSINNTEPIIPAHYMTDPDHDDSNKPLLPSTDSIVGIEDENDSFNTTYSDTTEYSV